MGISQNYGRGKLRRRLPSTTCITLGQNRRYMTPSRTARVIFENSKIYSIFGAPHLAPMGVSHRWLKIRLAPSSTHAVWKFQLASFKGSRNIKGGVKDTKMAKNRVKKISHNGKSQNKLLRIQANACEKVSPICLKTTSKYWFEIFRPIGRNANAKFKGASIFLGDEIQKSGLPDFAYCRCLDVCKISIR